MPDVTPYLTAIRQDPLAFLRHYKLQISGGDGAAQSGKACFRFNDLGYTVAGFTTKLSGLTGKTKQRPVIEFQRIGPRDPNADPRTGTFNAWYIAMKQVNDPVQDTHFPLPDNRGPDLMLTSQLSGCTFGIGSKAQGVQLVSHIQPTGNNRAQLHTTVTGGMANGVHKIFERENQPANRYRDQMNRATVIGVRTGTHWRFYAQVFESAALNGDVLEAKKI
jgi:hypothetical protein